MVERLESKESLEDMGEIHIILIVLEVQNLGWDGSSAGPCA